ncbi:MAG: hypothetical protein R3C59_29085 [Planctomycetaceae bacterium]
MSITRLLSAVFSPLFRDAPVAKIDLRSQQPDDTASQSHSSFLRRFRWLIFLLLIIAGLPSLLTIASQHQAALKLVHPGLSRALQFRSMTTHWWAPVEITDIRLTDLTTQQTHAGTDASADSTLLFTATSFRTIQPLWKIVLSRGSGLQLRIHQPVVNVRVNDGRTNVEETMAKLFGESQSSGSTPMEVTVEDGTVRLLSNADTNVSGADAFTTISGINGTYSTLDATKRMPNIALVADVGRPEAADAGGNGQPSAVASGINPRIAATLDELAGDFPLIPFSDTQMAVLKSDESQPTLKIQIATPQGSDVQNISVEARTLNLAELEPLIRRVLPGTKCVGEVSLRLQAHLLEDGSADGFAGRIQLQGDNIRWRNTTWAVGESLDLPSVSVHGAVALAEDGLLVNDLKVASTLLDLSGNGEIHLAAVDPAKAIAAAAAGDHPDQQRTVAEAQAAAAGQVQLQGRIDLARLTQMLPRTLHVEDGVIAESGDLRFSCRIQQQAEPPSTSDLFASSGARFRWRLLAETSPLNLTRDGRRIVIDSPLRLDAIGDLTTARMGIQQAQISGAFGSLSAAPATFNTVSGITTGSANGYAITGTVNPDRLWNDLKQIIDLPRPGLTSDLAVETRLKLDSTSITLAGLKLQSSEIEVTSPRLMLIPSAPIVQMFDGTLTVNGTSAALKTLVAPWHSATWLASNSTVTARLTADPAQQITVEAFIQRSQVMHNASLYRTISAGVVTADAAWEINQGKLEASLVADQTPGSFRVQKGTIEIPGAKSLVSGSLSVIGNNLVVNLNADTQYDLSLLTGELLNDPGQQIQLTGMGRDIFHLEGCPGLWTETDVAKLRLSEATADGLRSASDSILQPLHATGRIAWESGRLYGLPLGSGAAAAELRNGLLRTEPIQCSLSSGQVSVMPQWDLVSNRIQLAPGSRIENLQVTPELSREWLGYVAPMLADAASVQGTLSVRLQQFDYNLNRPVTSTVHGELSLQNATSSPGTSVGPLLQLLSLIDRDGGGLSQRLDFPDQIIPFELRDGMVRHDGLQIQFGDYRLSSSGGVSMDRRVQLALTVPLEKNAGNTAGRTVQIPVSGTIDRPQLDTAGLIQNLGRQQIQNQVDQQLNRGLNKLFDKLR